MALMFPVVLLVMNLTSIGVLWFGGQRIDSGGMQIGALTAFLSYIMQILMAVMMSTMMFMIVPRAEVSAERITAVLDTETTVVPARRAGHRAGRSRAPGAAGRELRLPGGRGGRAARRRPRRRAGQDHGDHRVHRCGQDHLLNLVPRLFDVTDGQVLVDGVDVRDLELDALWSRIGLVPQKPFLFSGTVAIEPALRRRGRHRRGAVARAGDRPGHAVRAGDGRPRGPDRPGRHQRVRRPAPAAGDRPGPGAQAGDLPVRRLVLGAGLRDRRGAAPRPDARDTRGDGARGRPAGQHDPARGPDHRARGRPGRRRQAPTTS